MISAINILKLVSTYALLCLYAALPPLGSTGGNDTDNVRPLATVALQNRSVNRSVNFYLSDLLPYARRDSCFVMFWIGSFI